MTRRQSSEITVGVAVIGQHVNLDRLPRRRRRRIVNGDGGAIAGRLAFEGGADADVAHALRVAQPACASTEAEIGEVGVAEELRSDGACCGAFPPAARRRWCSSEFASRIPGDTHGMQRPVLDIGEGHGRGGEGAVGVEETGVVGGDVGAA